MNSLAKADSGGDSPRQPGTMGAGQNIRAVISALLDHLGFRDNPTGGGEEETDSGLRLLLLNLRVAWIQLRRKMAESDQSMEAVRPFIESVDEVVADLGSYIDIKRLRTRMSANASESNLSEEDIKDLHAWNVKLVKAVDSLHEQCQRGVLAQFIEDVPGQQGPASGE